MGTATVRAPMTGQQLGHYRVNDKIGAGAMGEVYHAHDEHLDRSVAIKVLAPGLLVDAEARRRFRDEALMISRLAHPNIATVHDFDSVGEVDFLVTELITGCSLSERIAAGPLPEKEVFEIGLQLADALMAAHAAGLIHRDLKPSNLRLTADGRLKVLDFGLAVMRRTKDLSTVSTQDSAMHELAGTLPYMAPEQLRGEPVDPRSDLYSAGAVLYELATGHRPFEQTLIPALTDAILHKPPIPPGRMHPALSPALDEIVLRCLDKNPDHRYQSAQDLLAALRRTISTGGVAATSIAVLYFENLAGPAGADDYFRDGMTEDIITELARIRDLRVLSRSAVLQFRDRPLTPYFVGQQLGASHVVEGSVRREADRLRVTTKLVDTRTGHALWAERFDRKLEDVFAIQDEIAHKVAGSLRLVLTEQERRTIEKVPTRDVTAYDFYLRGRHFFHQFSRRGLDLAREMFAEAIEHDAGFARAHAGLAYCSGFLFMYWESSDDNLAQADAASRKALELDPDLAEAHAARGLAASLKKDYAAAEQEFRVAMRLDPRLFEPYYFYARSLYTQGKLEAAVQWFDEAGRVLPEDYQAPMLMASALHGLGRTEAAREAYLRGLAAAEQHLKLYPGDARARYFGANALTQLNDAERAVEWAERALQLEPDEHQVLYNVACVYALLGQSEKAIDCLERSLTRGWAQREWMLHDPDLASLRDHPRFRALMGV